MKSKDWFYASLWCLIYITGYIAGIFYVLPANTVLTFRLFTWVWIILIIGTLFFMVGVFMGIYTYEKDKKAKR